MCGIAGVLGAATPGQDHVVKTMIDALAHRGPDGLRQEIRSDAVLAHARLSIIDLEGGWQPLHAAGSTVVGNGEIYNYLELSEAFGLGRRLATGSDFEPLLHLYQREGERAFDRLRGMYAFCLMGGDGRTWLVRDPFGIKPLYVLVTNGLVYFASEAGPLQALTQTPPLNASATRQLLALNYTLGHPLGAPLENDVVSRLPAGGVFELVGQRLVERRRRSGLPAGRPAKSGGKTKRRWSERETLKDLDAVLSTSVEVHQRSDAPYGLFLSGGVDSATIAVLMARLNTRPVRAFTCGFGTPGVHDERPAAETLARALDLDWSEVLFSSEDFWRLAPVMAASMDDPTSDFACLPTLRLAEAAGAELKVILSGEGGDEIFAGYGRYRRARRPAWLGGRPAEPQAEAILWGLGAAAGATDPLEAWRAAARAGASPGDTALQAAQRADVGAWLEADLLVKLDRCLMAHGLEGRTPFLDDAVASFAFNLPDHFKIRGRFGKWVLRRWLAEHCPAAQPWRKKRGFTVPVAAFIEPRAARIGQGLRDSGCLSELITSDTLAGVFTGAAGQSARWPLLFLGLWTLIHRHGAGPREAAQILYGG